MRSIERRFNKVKSSNESLGDYCCLVEAVQGQKFTRRRLYTYFKKLVSKDEYDEDDTNMLVRHLYKVSNILDECIFFTEIDLQTSKISNYDTNYKIDKFQLVA